MEKSGGEANGEGPTADKADMPRASLPRANLLQEKTVIRRIAAWGLGLNAVWEFAHAGPLYDMWAEVGFGSGLFHITLAILGDGLIVLGVAGAASFCVGPRHVLRCTWKAAAVMLGIGLVAAFVLEWIPRELGWWTYNELMPTLHALGETVGLAPLAQITLLPVLSVFLATRFHARPN